MFNLLNTEEICLVSGGTDSKDKTPPSFEVPKEMRENGPSASFGSGDISGSCCEWNFFGVTVKVDLFTVTTNLSNAQGNFPSAGNLSSPHNRL